ncbi:MAG: ATP-binding cassette domain-containing protein [Bauldia sp.]|nr:ATP-binding cassette domain-containing protein [Bauldia sp.]
MAGEPIIETRDLKMTFKTRAGTVEAVKGIDLTVHAGESFGFLGPNGAGKTTTLRILATLMTPTGGSARIAGVDLLKNPGKVRERIGFVGQTTGSDSSMTGRGEIVYQGQFYGLSKTEAAARADHLLKAFDLADAADRRSKTYSGGMRRRLDVAMGMIHQPPILFLDEPTTGLDPQARARMWDEVKRLRDSGTTVFLTTHYLDEADALCDRVAIIDHGKIVALGTPDELKRQIGGDVITLGVPADRREETLALVAAQPFVRKALQEDDTIRLYVEQGEAVLPQVLRLVDGAGIPVETIAYHRPSLNDVFLQQTGRSLRDAA